MKKILFVASSLRIGGMERVLVDIANALSSRGYDITIITYEDSGKENFIGELNSNITFYYKTNRDFRIKKALPYFHRFYRPNKWETRCPSKDLYRYYVGNKNKYDVEIAFCRGPAVKIISGSTNKRSKKLTWVHNDYNLINQKTITKFFDSMESTIKAYDIFDKIVAVSNKAGQSFTEVIGYPEKLLTIYNMIDLKKIDQKRTVACPIKKSGFTFISVARLIPAKGHDKLLRVVKRLNNENYNFFVWIVGSGDMGQYEMDIKKYSDDNQLTNVIFMGRQMNPYSFMNIADAYICTSYTEGFPIALEEAMACGLPVISTRCTGTTEILENGKYGVMINGTEEEIYQAMKNVIMNPDLLLPYKKQSIKRSKDFSENKIIDDIISLF